MSDSHKKKANVDADSEKKKEAKARLRQAEKGDADLSAHGVQVAEQRRSCHDDLDIKPGIPTERLPDLPLATREEAVFTPPVTRSAAAPVASRTRTRHRGSKKRSLSAKPSTAPVRKKRRKQQSKSKRKQSIALGSQTRQDLIEKIVAEYRSGADWSSSLKKNRAYKSVLTGHTRSGVNTKYGRFIYQRFDAVEKKLKTVYQTRGISFEHLRVHLIKAPHYKM